MSTTLLIKSENVIATESNGLGFGKKALIGNDRGIGTRNVKKEENKGAKLEIELLLTFLKLAKMNNTKDIKNLKKGPGLKKSVKVKVIAKQESARWMIDLLELLEKLPVWVIVE
ncbi:hypothetical protein F8M41_015995 [Gigaspora margarita]|uniref:Uncharacterized protein n=1 Tax=Gigaspora margarita TaxID=4874 RepID=A0A8H4B367_GIGMA|nr:hypothetical protein F8M41_015995 [Gigaspora margarita]